MYFYLKTYTVSYSCLFLMKDGGERVYDEVSCCDWHVLRFKHIHSVVLALLSLNLATC